MRKLLTATAVVVTMGFSLPATAGQCPKDIKQIDAAMSGNSSLSSAQMSRVMSLRAEGAGQHKAGQHKSSVETLAKAKKILGIM